MKTVLITGANSGLGFEVAKLFAKDQYQVVLVCRNLSKANKTKDKIVELFPESKIILGEAELSSINSVKSCVANLNVPIDFLICNAGIATTKEPEISQDGIELIFSVNHLAHYTLAVELYNRFPQTLKTITVVSSNVHNPAKTKGQFPKPEFSSISDFAHPSNDVPIWKTEADRRYVHSKLANILFTYGMANKLKGNSSTKINAFNPGFMLGTNLSRDQSLVTRFMLKNVMPLMKPFIKEMRTVEESAEDLKNVCLEPNTTGAYFDGREIARSSELSYEEKWIDTIWDLSEKLTKTSLIV